MELIQIFSLAIVQGLTEFLPVSSSAHLILLPVLLGWDDQGLSFDVAVHLGTLVAVVIYFRTDLHLIAAAWFRFLSTRKQTTHSRLGWAILFGTIPVGLSGLLLNDIIEADFRSPMVIATATVVFGLLLWLSDSTGKRRRDEFTLTGRDVLFIGCAQAIALIPGTSRSGITITAGLMLGLTREAAARFSFLLSIPVIVLAGGLKTVELMARGDSVYWGSLLLGMILSGLSAYLCIHWFIKAFAKIGMLPFVLYRLALGAILLLMFW